MKEIFLSDGSITSCDDKNFLYLLNYKWYIQKGTNTNYAWTTTKINNNKIYYSMHGLVIKRKGITIPKGYEIDHIDRDGLNNQEYNLRIVKRGFNCFNSNLRNTNISGYTGVHYCTTKRNGKHIFG
jgi:HNH endonuclease